MITTSKNMNEEINFQTYVNEVKHGKIRWKIFVNFMKDLSYSDRDRLRRLNAILVTELTMNFSDIEKLRYLNAILLTQFKNFIQKEYNFEDDNEDKTIFDNSQPIIDNDLNEIKVEEMSTENGIQESMFIEKETNENQDLLDENDETSECGQSIPNSMDLNTKIEESSKDCEIQASIFQENDYEEKSELDTSNKDISVRKLNIQIFQCNICNKQYGMKFHLNQHIRNVHEKTKMDNIDFIHKDVCMFDDASGTTDTIINAHENSNIGDLKKQLYTVNDTCGKSFSEAGSLKKHINTIQEGHKDLKCESCGKLFSQAAHLKTHIQSVHEGHKDHKCESCGKSFSHAHSLRKHIQTIHESHKDH